MRRVVHVRQVRAYGLPRLESSDGLDEHMMQQSLAGYITGQFPTLRAGRLMVSSCLLVVTDPLGESEVGMAVPMQLSSSGTRPKPLRLRPVGRLVRVAAPKPTGDVTPSQLPSEARTPAMAHTLRPVRGGCTYSMTSSPTSRLVRPELAEALEAVFERFARERGFTSEQPLAVRLSRGFKAGSHGHGEGRAADIAAVGGKGLLAWKQEWDQAMSAADRLPQAPQRAQAIASEQQRNLGYALYKALQEHGGWRVDQHGWRPYRGVMQLFGPWTASEGPWKALHIEDPTPYQQQRLADQQWVFRAHQDHIHVAK